MGQLPITLTERMKMILIELFIDDDDGDGNDDGDDEIERVWSCMLCVLGRPLS